MSEQERRNELAHFLKDRRARISPAAAGLPQTRRRRVPGLRREEVALLAGIGVSWYTALENASAAGVSEATLLLIADVLKLTESERHYVIGLANNSAEPDAEPPGPLIIETMMQLRIPAYIINAAWHVLSYNDAFRTVWSIGENEIHFNAIERLFIHPEARRMHGDHFIANITPVIGMFRSGVGRHPELQTLHGIRDRLLQDEAVRTIWDAYEITSPLVHNSCTITTAKGIFCYRTLDLPVPGAAHGLVVHVPDESSRNLL